MKKRLRVVFLVLLMAASLIGCGEQETVYEADINGIALQVDIAEKTISDGKHIYRYNFSGDFSSYHVKITYPNGSSYWWSESEYSGAGSWSDDYVADAYVSGNILVSAVAAAEGVDNTKQGNFGNVLAGLILIAFGVFELFAPETAWYLGYGWRYKDAEPSDAALTASRVGGGIAVFMGIGFLLLF